LLDQAQAEPDPEKRAEFLAQAEGLVLESYAIVPLWHEATYALVSPIVSGWEPTPMDMHLSRWMSLQEN
jgi:oligopeptide transport system substrate-binding protein